MLILDRTYAVQELIKFAMLKVETDTGATKLAYIRSFLVHAKAREASDCFCEFPLK